MKHKANMSFHPNKNQKKFSFSPSRKPIAMMDDDDNNDNCKYCESFQRAQIKPLYIECVGICCAGGPLVLGWLVWHLNACNISVSQLWMVLELLQPLRLILSLRIVNGDLKTSSNGVILVSLHDFALGNYFKNAL